MNERIKELYNQSGGLVRMYDGKLTYFPAYQKNVGDGNFEFSSFDPEKFAELIVKECLRKCEDIRSNALEQKSSEFLTEAGKTLYEGVFGGATNCGYSIQQHFGIEL